jgi:hypothetical protein
LYCTIAHGKNQLFFSIFLFSPDSFSKAAKARADKKIIPQHIA